MHIKIRKGKDLPLFGKPTLGSVKQVEAKLASLNLSPFPEVRFSLCKKVGDKVTIGEPIAFDKANPKRKFVSPASGVIKEVIRGEKRRILDIVMELDSQENYYELGAIDLKSASKEEILEKWLEAGVFSHIRKRPCNTLADPSLLPKSIFIKALESAPFVPDPELEAKQFSKEFAAGLATLEKLGVPIHMVHCEKSEFFSQYSDVQTHTAQGPHPVANPSLHIYHIDPIYQVEDIRWTLSVHDVIIIGALSLHGRYHNKKVITLGGGGFTEDVRQHYLVQDGIALKDICLVGENIRVISGDPLCGAQISPEGFLGFYHTSFSAFHEKDHRRELFHFFRLGRKKYTTSHTYLAGFAPQSKEFDLDTNQHGEERAFVDTEIYDRVMPMKIPTMPLIKALICENFELAQSLGLLEVDAEDFALPTFVCPSKIDMVSIVRKNLLTFAEQYL